MAVSPSFRAFVEEQLADAKRVSTKMMFGGTGIYWEGIFFALIDNDILYFKVDDQTRPGYQARGSLAFDPYGNGQRMESYYEVPGEVLEDRRLLGEWRETAVQVAIAAKSRPAVKPAKGKSRSKPRSSAAAPGPKKGAQPAAKPAARPAPAAKATPPRKPKPKPKPRPKR